MKMPTFFSVAKCKSFLSRNHYAIVGVFIAIEAVMVLIILTYYVDPLLERFGDFGRLITRIITLIPLVAAAWKNFELSKFFLKFLGELSLVVHMTIIATLSLALGLAHYILRPFITPPTQNGS